MKKRILNGLKWTAIYTLSTLLFFEVILWIMGYRPYANEDYKVRSSPEQPYVGDPDLGIQLREGTYTITLNDAVTFKTTHLSNGERKIPNSTSDTLPEVLFLGCSFTYGYGVNDAESFPARVQATHQDWHVRNAAVVGYGTAQHLLQLQERLKKDPPKCVVLSFSSVHFARTVLSQNYRANLRIGYRRSGDKVDDRMQGARFPYVVKCGEVKHQNWEGMYPEIWGRYTFASANFIQSYYDNAKEPDCDPIEITACLIKEMAQLCAEKNIEFAVVCLDSSPETRKLEQKLPKIAWKNIGFSFADKKLTHLPHDSHPNTLGHQSIATRLLPFLEKLMADV